MPASKPADTLDTTLDALFPVGATTVLSLGPQIAGDLTPIERALAAKFAPARLAEFRHGRACARQALRRLGVGPHDIPIGDNREPLWLPGIVGSISHAGEVAAAVVARQSDFSSVGLDLEPASPLEPGLMTRICLPAELAGMATNWQSAGETAKLIFSIKEAAYKALWPLLRQFLDFHDIELQVNTDQSTFSVISRTDRCPPDLASRIQGRFMRVRDLFAAGATLR